MAQELPAASRRITRWHVIPQVPIAEVTNNPSENASDLSMGFSGLSEKQIIEQTRLFEFDRAHGM